MVNPSTSEAEIIERAASLANQVIFTDALQYRRLRTVEPEDDVFAFHWWAALEFLIVAVGRAAQLAARVPAFTVMRNVGEHIADYAVDHPGRHHKDVERRQWPVGSWDGRTYCWLGHELTIDDALAAGKQPYLADKNAAGRGSERPSQDARLRPKWTSPMSTFPEVFAPANQVIAR